MAHAYSVIAPAEEGINQASKYVQNAFNLPSESPDLVVLHHIFLSVEDARKISDIAYAMPVGEHKVVIVAATRFFHEAQNALLKLFEEPPLNTTLILVIPSEGILLSTLRSRLAPLPKSKEAAVDLSELAQEYLEADPEERKKLIDKLLDRSKSDKPEEKQRARSDAVRLAEDLLRSADSLRASGKNTDELLSFMDDLSHFLPLLHTRSAPLKLIFEHLDLVIPKGLGKRNV